MEFHKVLKNGPKNKIYTIFERGEHIEFKYILKMRFAFIKISKKGSKPKF